MNAIYSNSIGVPAPCGNQHHLSATQQIVAHVGGMVRAVIRHRPINWTFHWRGICRAVRPTLASLERGREKSGASPIALNTSTS